MKILKASAGSGKTYRLSKTYIDLLMNSRNTNPYRHILAVTFTNKATSEMKTRILNDLAELSKTDPKARKILVQILHDYSAFAVSTIDKFFQQALKAFSREIGQFADYQVELDKDSLIQETMDRILDSLGEDKSELISWINASVFGELEKGKKLSIEEKLYSIGKLLKNEEHRSLVEKLGIDDMQFYTHEKLSGIHRKCSAIIRKFEDDIRAMGMSVEPNKMADFSNKKTLLKKNPELAAYKEDNYSLYCSAYILDELVFSLGLAAEFYKEFDALTKEKNVLCLDESNTILQEIIAGSDAPFVYEKLGVRYENFLLDEFQDTSTIQWSNFLPLLKESDSKAGENLIVGDVKQSIYRFRGSEWKLLGEELVKDFPDSEEEILDSNWRSAREIVCFNNAFFSSLAKKLGIENIYSDVEQFPQSKGEDQRGFVKIEFSSEQNQSVLDSIRFALDCGARYSDIAILVRNNLQGSDLAAELIQAGYPVVSDDSLKIKSSVIVRRVGALLRAFDNPKDLIYSYLASKLEIEFPKSYHSLVELCEQLLRALQAADPASFDGEVLFIQAFMDELKNWVQLYGNNLAAFLEYWDEKDPCIASPEDAAAIRVLTVHKAKGLEFPYVIFPYAEKVNFYKSGAHWCELDDKSFDEGIYPVELGPKSENSFFRGAYLKEREAQLIDNINVFYVSLTRASKVLHVIAKPVSKTFRESLSKGKPEYKDFSQCLYEFVGQQDEAVFGEPYDFSRMGRKAGTEIEDFPAKYNSIALGGRLTASTDAREFFGEDVVGIYASARLKGIVLHDILSGVIGPEDIGRELEHALLSGKLDEKSACEARELLETRVAAHPEWFPSDSTAVYCEQSIYDPTGHEHRPDRVVFTPEGVIIIDFKFGARKPEYLSQLRRYASLYKKLGYEIRAAIVWYVIEDSCVSVDL